VLPAHAPSTSAIANTETMNLLTVPKVTTRWVSTGLERYGITKPFGTWQDRRRTSGATGLSQE